MEILLGRVHPLLVHLPIGFLVMAFILELVSLSKRGKKIRRAVLPVLYSGIVAGIVAAGSGFLLAREGGQDEDLLFRHQLFAILSLIGGVLLAMLIELGKVFSGRAVRMLLFIFMITCLSLAGHFGGMMTHGRDYLTATALASTSHPQSPVDKSGRNDTRLMYRDLVRPILAEKCYSCHSQARQKGKLRLDSETAIRHGGKHGSILEGESELIARVSRSVEEEGHMPPREKDQLTSMEIELLTAWVKSGASFTAPADSIPSNLVLNALRKMSEESSGERSWLPETTGLSSMSEKELEALRLSGMRITPVAIGSPWLEVTSSGPDAWGSAHWKIWEKISNRIVSARFSFAGISDAQLAIVSKAPELRRLMCDHTGISDAGLQNLKNAYALQRLNIADVKITPAGLNSLGKLPELRDLIVYDCGLDSLSVSGFQKKFPHIKVIAGKPKLPFLPTDTIEFR